MKNEKGYKDLLKYASEQVALEDFQQEGETHKFSSSYDEKMKKLLAMEDNKEGADSKGNKKIVKFSKKKIAMVALVAVLALGTVAVTAATRGNKIRLAMIPDANDPYTGVMVDADNMTDEELINHEYIEFEIPEGAQNEDGTPVTKESILAGDAGYMKNDPNDHIDDEIYIGLNTETGELLEVGTFNYDEEDPTYFMLEVPEDAQYEDGTLVTKERLLTGEFPELFEQELIDNDVIDLELLDKIKQMNK